MHPQAAQSGVDNQSIRLEKRGAAALITLDRPKQLNALNDALSREVLRAAQGFDADPEVGAIVLAGSQKAFAAGADIKEMLSKSFADLFTDNYFAAWDQLATIRKPLIAAVNGFALGGGCELAMMCDFIIAGQGAQFGQPEIKLGILPGIGGSQRLTKLVGRSLAMDLILTGRLISAEEARSAGLVARVVPDDQVLAVALEAAATIAGYSAPAVMMAKEAVNRAEETALTEGLLHERRLFQASFATQGQKEGMSAFLEKRKPAFSGR
ncbi:enoyl-CoA hydratase [Bradyrhizobium centrolobii]|uniref:enoyl-CoA hydratase n=1 Tax=Bradyrhizobium centrolobii TaxID=1505087 RepID=A0A176YZI0_9BRAD|nr:enoyl-CoA hydratase-related protein [Bradyrhizobium centrolobii]OAF12309.1 enoyl-CoA hydratase [Bradyrhizobium centrolobii]